jgi:hypothetical protein
MAVGCAWMVVVMNKRAMSVMMGFMGLSHFLWVIYKRCFLCLRRPTFLEHPRKVGKRRVPLRGALNGLPCFYGPESPSPAHAVPTPCLAFHAPFTHTSHPHQRHNGPHHLWVILGVLERFHNGEEGDDDQEAGRDEAEGAEEAGFFGVCAVGKVFSVFGEHAV